MFFGYIYIFYYKYSIANFAESVGVIILKKSLSLIVPCYNEEHNVRDIYEEILKQEDELNKMDIDMEIIFVDDGSTDNTANEIEGLEELDDRVNAVVLSKNFGKESAMYAGLVESKGDYVGVIDADLQDPPSLLPQMLASVMSGKCDCVATRRVDRKGEPPIRSFFARKFYKIMNKFSDVDIVDGARDFRVMTREMTDAIISVSEKNRFSKGIFSWIGFKTEWLEFENIERAKGETKWSFFKLAVYAIDGITAFSTKPLAISSIIGFLFFLLSIILIILIILRTLIFGDPVTGWPSLACVIFFVSGIQLFCIGILGLYLSKNYIESKNRPIYIKRNKNKKK